MKRQKTYLVRLTQQEVMTLAHLSVDRGLAIANRKPAKTKDARLANILQAAELQALSLKLTKLL